MIRLTELQQRLVAENLGLIYYTINGLRHTPGVKLLGEEPCVSAGHLGLCKAAMRFDPARGSKFSTFACAYIRGAILREAYQEEQHQSRLNSPSRAARLKRVKRDVSDLMLPVHEEPEERDDVIAAVEHLPGYLRDVIRSRYYGGESQTEIARRRGVTPQAIGDAERRALKLLSRRVEFV